MNRDVSTVKSDAFLLGRFWPNDPDLLNEEPTKLNVLCLLYPGTPRAHGYDNHSH